MNLIEIDFLYVESGEKSGDAIAFRYGSQVNIGAQKVVIIDGGTLKSGQNLVNHVNTVYNTNVVDLVICTHPDKDHSSGLREVLENCNVKRLWIHMPWKHSKAILDLFQDGRITADSLDARIKDEYNFAYELVQIAERRGIPIEEPFEGLEFDNGAIKILGPSVEYYRSLLPDFGRTPAAKNGLVEKAVSAIKEAVNWIRETLHMEHETLDESGQTSAENRSSAITLLSYDDKKFLFTGDAGIDSMHNAADYAGSKGISLTNIRFMQVPHHGSRRNISPSVLEKVLAETAYISASNESDKHPSKKVVNAFIRRRAQVFTTSGGSICFNINGGYRAGWGPIASLPFNDLVEE